MPQSKPFPIVASLLPKDLPDTWRVASAIESIVLENVVGTLVRLGPADRLYSYIAESWEVFPKQMAITFHLDKRARFNNGNPITADDVSFTFKRLLVKGATHLALRETILGAELVKQVTDVCPGIVVTNTHTITFRFTKPVSQLLLYIFSLPDGGIVSKSQINAKTLDCMSWQMCSGAYCIEKNSSDKLELAANKFFLNKTPGMLERITITQEPDMDLLVHSLVSGTSLYTLEYFFTEAHHYKELLQNDKIDILPRQFCGTQLLVLNKKRAPFNNKKMRQAFYRHFKQLKNFDLRPIADDRYFVPASHLVLPTSMGRPSESETAKLVAAFPKEPLASWEKEPYLWIDPNFIVGRPFADRIVAEATTLGAKFTRYDYKDSKDWLAQKAKMLFYCIRMFINEKELQQSFEYMTTKDHFYAENAGAIKKLTLELAHALEPKDQANITKKIAALITEDATMIPLYYIVQQDIINKDYEIINVNPFDSTPKLWNIRRKIQ